MILVNLLLLWWVMVVVVLMVVEGLMVDGDLVHGSTALSVCVRAFGAEFAIHHGSTQS